MDLVDSFVPSFKRKAPEAQSFVELKKIKKHKNIADIEYTNTKKNKKEEEFGKDTKEDKNKNKGPNSKDIEFVESVMVEPMVVMKSEDFETNANKVRLGEGHPSGIVTNKPGVFTTTQSFKQLYQRNLRDRIKNLYKKKNNSKLPFRKKLNNGQLQNMHKEKTTHKITQMNFEKRKFEIPPEEDKRIVNKDNSGDKFYVDDLLATSSYNQMKFWRNRFESERIKTFMKNKNKNKTLTTKRGSISRGNVRADKIKEGYNVSTSSSNQVSVTK